MDSVEAITTTAKVRVSGILSGYAPEANSGAWCSFRMTRFSPTSGSTHRTEARMVEGFTHTDKHDAWAKFFEISLEEPAMKRKEVR